MTTNQSEDEGLREQIQLVKRKVKTPDGVEHTVIEQLADGQVDYLMALISQKILEAEVRGAAFAVSVVDGLHNEYHGSEDKLYKGVKNTIRDSFKLQTGIDPAPDYPINVTLTQGIKE